MKLLHATDRLISGDTDALVVGCQAITAVYEKIRPEADAEAAAAEQAEAVVAAEQAVKSAGSAAEAEVLKLAGAPRAYRQHGQIVPRCIGRSYNGPAARSRAGAGAATKETEQAKAAEVTAVAAAEETVAVKEATVGVAATAAEDVSRSLDLVVTEPAPAFTISASATSTVTEVLMQIAQRLNIASADLRLEFAGMELDGTVQLEQAGLCEVPVCIYAANSCTTSHNMSCVTVSCLAAIY